MAHLGSGVVRGAFGLRLPLLVIATAVVAGAVRVVWITLTSWLSWLLVRKRTRSLAQDLTA